MKVLSFLWKKRVESFTEIRLLGGDVVWIDDLTKSVKLKIGQRTVQSLIALLNLIFTHRQFRNYDVMYVPSDFWTQVMGFFVARLNKMIFTIRLRDDPFEARRLILPTKTKFFAKMICVLFDKVDKAIYQRADLIISISHNLAKKFEEISKNMVTVWNGIDERFLKYELKQKKVPQEIVFGYVGRVSKEKGMELMFEALKGMPMKPLVFGAIRYSVIFPENVQYMGELPHERIEEAYSKFDVLVLPSFTEGLPRVLQEAMLLGKAVICTDTGDNAIIVDKEGGWVCQPTVKDVRRALFEAKKLGKNQLLNMGMYNRKKGVRIFYSWEEYAEKVKRLICTMLKRKNFRWSS